MGANAHQKQNACMLQRTRACTYTASMARCSGVRRCVTAVTLALAGVAVHWGARATRIVLSGGVGGYTADQLQELGTSWAAYASAGMLDAVSVLAYNLNGDGSLGVYATNDTACPDGEAAQRALTPAGVRAIPTLYCDATLGNCAGLSARLDALLAHADAFVADTLARAATHGWDGYAVDFEPDGVVRNATALSAFLVTWADALAGADPRRALYVWVGGDTPYDMHVLAAAPNVTLLSMDTYVSTFADFVTPADALFRATGTGRRVGYGVLTQYGRASEGDMRAHRHTSDDAPMNATELAAIVAWLCVIRADSLQLWASHASPLWYAALAHVRTCTHFKS